MDLSANILLRYTLNIKGIPYRTVWVEYPDIKPLCLKIGAAATEKLPDGSPLYTLPVIFDPNTSKAIADSAAIARYLDVTYPTHVPRLIPEDMDALHAAFQDRLGESPMAYVRRIRLQKVRAELLASDPERTRITDVAMRWGFFHQSRFAQQYREQFRELPSATLHR